MKEKKKELGQFFTEQNIADFMAKLVVTENTKTVLDPCVGPGILLKCINERKYNDIKYTAFEIDNEMISIFRSKNKFEVDLFECDYLMSNIDQKFDSIICNPPYNKFQSVESRKKYISLFEEKYGIKMSGYCNQCVYFLIKSLNELKATGKCAFIMPYEFFNSGYGVAVKKFLLEDKRIKTVFKFSNKIKLFSDAITTSCVLFFDGTEHDKVNFVTISELSEIENENFNNSIEYSFYDLKPEEKWNTYFKNSKSDYKNLIMFKDIAKVKRGIATGNNKYFCLSASDLERYGISQNARVRCVSKSADVNTLIFTESDYDALEKLDKKSYLFDGCAASTTSDFDYIKHGEQIKVDSSYLNSHRSPWYSLENREIAPIWISVFSRGKLKIIRNETNTKNLTTFHGIYLNVQNENLINVFFCYLLTPICQQILYENKREYGNGLDKFEPNDLNEAKVLDIFVVQKEDIDKILGIYRELKGNRYSYSKIEELNFIFSKYIC